MFRSKIKSILTTPLFTTKPEPEPEPKPEPALYYRRQRPMPVAPEPEPTPEPEPMPEVWYPTVIQVPVAVASPAEAALQKVEAAKKAAEIKHAELMEQVLLQEKTKDLLREMEEGGLLPRQLFHLELEVTLNQSDLNDLIDELGF